MKIIAAYYYNRGYHRGQQVSICYKHDAMMFGTGIAEMERGGVAGAVPYVWQTDTAVANNSWCYTDSLQYKSPGQIVCGLINAVSKNGNLLLNVGPKGNGRVVIRSLARPKDQKRALFHGLIKDVGVLGFKEKPGWYQDEEGLHIHTCQIAAELPVVLKVTIL